MANPKPGALSLTFNEPAPEGQTFLALINFDLGMGTWGRDPDPKAAVKHAVTAARQDFKVPKSSYPLQCILWLVPDESLHWEADSVPRWEGHEGEDVTWWRVLAEKDGTFQIDREYMVNWSK